jgi:hypothetical protein
MDKMQRGNKGGLGCGTEEAQFMSVMKIESWLTSSYPGTLLGELSRQTG